MRRTRKQYLNEAFAKMFEEANGPSDLTEEEKEEWQRRKKNREIRKAEGLEML